MDRRHHHPVGPYHVHQQARAHHVGHRVQRAHLVEVDLRDRRAVDLGLRLGDQAVHRLGVPLHGVGQRQAVDDAVDVVRGGVVMVVMPVAVVMVMVMLVPMVMMMLPAQRHVLHDLLLPVHRDGDVRAQDAALLGPPALEPHPGQLEPVHRRDEPVRVGDQLRQRGHQHVPRRAHVAFDVEYLH